MDLFNSLGFTWDRVAVRAVPPALKNKAANPVCARFARFEQRLDVFVWDAAVLEDNPMTLPEVQALLAGGEVRHRKLADKEQVLNLAQSAKHLLGLVKSGQFELSKSVFTELNGIVARNEALEWGVFRGEGQERHYTPNVGLGEAGHYTPLATAPGAPELNRVFGEGIK